MPELPEVEALADYLHLVTHLTHPVGQRAAESKGEKRSGLVVHTRTGLPCPVGGETIREVPLAGSSLRYRLVARPGAAH